MVGGAVELLFYVIVKTGAALVCGVQTFPDEDKALQSRA